MRRMGQAKLFNTMILGGYLKVRPVVEMENVMVGLKKSLPERAWKMLPRQRGGEPATAARSSARYADGSGFRWFPKGKSRQAMCLPLMYLTRDLPFFAPRSARRAFPRFVS